TALTAGAAFPVWNEQALAQMSRLQTIPPGAIRINANENPLGPSADAADAIHGIVRNGGRYMYDLTDALAREMAEGLGVKYSSNPDESYIRIFAGSSAPLHQAVFAFASKDRPFVKADPGYEAGEWAAKFSGASVVNVPLKDKTWEHDVKAMLQMAPNGGLYYVCNPNNPTGTVTSRADIEYLVANKPSSAVVMIDEAYIHFSKSATPCCDLAAAGNDVLILRTFSKIYGMAGLRAGAAIARPDLLQKVAQFSMGAMPVTAMAGALASLRAPNLVAERRKYMSDIRDATCDWLAKQNVEFIPSETNCFMINVKRPGPEFYRAMAAQNIYIGRAWPVWPNWVRVSVGTAEEMAKFRDAFAKAYNA
ncbi:MAG TPA: pyridoxal phosphate-dependent aminotransferase, partial [Bryobacteraceae bacterium]|nr:pyridoxal phosphate-dependent aminotransferase [Bryobacteraceae bacterium]